MSTPVIIEAALNGVTSPRRNPAVPTTPEDLAAVGLACLDAGASIIHTHGSDLLAPPERRAAEYAACYRPILAVAPDAILYPTQHAHVAMLASEGLIRASVLDPGSVNLGGTGADGLPPESDFVYTNTYAATRYAMDLSVQHRLGPSVAIYEPGWLQVIMAYHRAGALPAGTLVKFYFAAGGYIGGGAPLWGSPPIPEALDVGRRRARRRHLRDAHRGPRPRARRSPARRPRGRPVRALQRRARRTGGRSRGSVRSSRCVLCRDRGHPRSRLNPERRVRVLR